jgi:hypothetical protein
MKSRFDHYLPDDDAAARRRLAEATVSRHVHELFRRLQRLEAFRLGPDLTVVDVSVNTSAAPRGMLPLVMQAIVELTECHPEAVQLMRGRTFARSLH